VPAQSRCAPGAGRVSACEITEKQKRLTDTAGANVTQRAALEKQVETLETEVQDPRTTEATAAAFEEARLRLAGAVRLMASAPGNPFTAAAELQGAAERLASTQDQVRSDWAARAEAEQRISEATGQLEAAQRLAHQAQTDSVSDSDALRQAYRDGDALAERLRLAQTGLGKAHGQWAELRQEADQILGQALRVAAVLRGELEAGQAAIAALAAASGVVGRANAWRGGFGATVFGSPGGQALDQARALLAAGSYVEALRAAEAARRAAQTAIAEAEAEELRRRRAEQERLEQERRRRQEEERRRHDALSQPVFGSSGLGHSGFSFGSGTSHSSFSSGSGVSRSGW
jgi:hypothetical protein